MKDITGLDLGLAALLVLAIVAMVILWVKMRRLARQVAEFPGREAEIRADARKRSRISHMASISEQLAPLLPGFRYNPKDVQWIGGGGAVDAIVWNGLEAGGEVEVVFLDVKVGRQARFTDNQCRIRDAIMWKRVAFDEYRPPETSPLIEAAALELPHDTDVTDLADQEVGLVCPEAPGATDTGERVRQ
jgi:predicted Holliday junction resolvase-like endonuclease